MQRSSLVVIITLTFNIVFLWPEIDAEARQQRRYGETKRVPRRPTFLRVPGISGTCNLHAPLAHTKLHAPMHRPLGKPYDGRRCGGVINCFSMYGNKL